MSSQGAQAGLLAETLATFLDRLASDAPAPGGGGAAAVAVAMAAALVAMAGRFAPAVLPDADAVVAEAEELRSRVGPLPDADARAYTAVLEALRLPKAPDPEPRRQAVRAALSAAAEVPLAVAEAASSVAALAHRLANEGNPNLRGDALTAAALAAGAARAAAELVAENLARQTGDLRPAKARACARRAEGALRAILTREPS